MRRKVEAIIVRATLALLLIALLADARAQNAEPNTDELISRTFRVHVAAIRNALPRFIFANDEEKPKVLREDSSERLVDELRAAFAIAGVHLEDIPPTAPRPNQKAMFLNERTGLLIVRATAAELAKIENVLASLPSQPEVSIETRFIEVASAAPAPPPILISPQPSPDDTLTARQVTVKILTEKEARELLRQYEATAGADVITPPHVTTISGRQARIQTEDTTKTPLYQDPPELPKDTAPDADPTPHNKGRLPLPPTLAPERLGSAI